MQQSIYNLDFLVRHARLHSDERESGFFSDEEVVDLLNEALSQCYVNICNNNQNYFVTSTIIEANDERSFCIPESVYQIRGVDRLGDDGRFWVIRPTDLVQRDGNLSKNDEYGYLQTFLRDTSIQYDNDYKYYVIGDEIRLDGNQPITDGIRRIRIFFTPKPPKYEIEADLTTSVTDYRSIARNEFVKIAKEHLLETKVLPEPEATTEEAIAANVASRTRSVANTLIKQYILETVQFNEKSGRDMDFPPTAARYVYTSAAWRMASIRSTNPDIQISLMHKYNEVKKELMEFVKERIQGTPGEITKVSEPSEYY